MVPSGKLCIEKRDKNKYCMSCIVCGMLPLGKEKNRLFKKANKNSVGHEFGFEVVYISEDNRRPV